MQKFRLTAGIVSMGLSAATHRFALLALEVG